MAFKSKFLKSWGDRPLPAVAAMKFWSRFQNPPPLLAFAFPEQDEDFDGSFDVLRHLPAVSADDSTVFSIRVSLDRAKPPIWRRVLVKAINLETLHHLIQMAMGWDDAHLHGFEISKVIVPLVEEGDAINERSISIAQLHAAKIKKFRYVYDFGDAWNHTVLIEDCFTAPLGQTYPQCIAGKGMCPLEDIGGIENWSKLLHSLNHLEAVGDKGEIRAMLDRVGEGYAPSAFDLEETNAKLQRAFNKKLRRKGIA